MRYDLFVAHAATLLVPAALLAGTAVFAFEPAITPRLISDAVLLGQSRIESTHVRYHQPYRLQVGRAPIDYIDVVTPFRRVVLLSEERAQAGARGFTQREAMAALGEQANFVELRVEMTFHPLNTFVGVPGYDVALVGTGTTSAGLTVAPRDMIRVPRFGPRTDAGPLPTPPGSLIPNQPGISEPVTGGTIIAVFPVNTVDGSGTYDLVVMEKEKELARTRVNFGVLR